MSQKKKKTSGNAQKTPYLALRLLPPAKTNAS